MEPPSRGFRWGALLWSIAAATVVIVIAGSVLMPSTKRGSINIEELRRLEEERSAEMAAPVTEPDGEQSPEVDPDE